MKILVCLKQVPDTDDIKWTENNTLQRDGVESITNPCDVYAIEHALSFKRITNAEITVLTMGPLQAEDMLKKALALGCDRAVLLTDKKFAGADTYATGRTLAGAIKSKLNDFDLILCGQFAIDGDTAQTGPSLAGLLQIPQVTYAKELDRFDGKSIYVTREIEEGLETVKIELPALICVVKNSHEPSRATINGIKKAQNSKITIYSLDDIGLDADNTGLKGSPTYVSRAFRPEHNRTECYFCEDLAKLAEKIKEFGGINE